MRKSRLHIALVAVCALAACSGGVAPARASPKAARAAKPLAGKVVGIDPGHNGRNYSDPSFINHTIWNGRESETCDTTGTETDGGYTEAQLQLERRWLPDLGARGRGRQGRPDAAFNNDGVGPCVTTRAQIIDRARANVAIDIHGDGGPPDGRGFAILLPVADGPNDRVIAPSRRFALDLRARFAAGTGMPDSTYDGVDGLEPRNDLAGLNLTTVPKVLIECGNMRNATDAALLANAGWQRRAASAMARAITEFLRAR